ncbi:MAG: methylenetetrahydrofolate reductase [NAD(P)H] [bacterium]
MKFPAPYRSNRPVVSFELFPPKTDKGLADLEERLPHLLALEPTFLTVTYGAGGTTRERTLDIARRIRGQYGRDVAHHLTCVGATRDEITRTLGEIRDAGIENLVALRGDPPQGQTEFRAVEGGFRHACELVAHVRAVADFGIAVAGYPEKHVEAPDWQSDIAHLKEKVDAGADVVLTQLFYDNRDFHRFVERCRAAGIRAPIVPGLMPIQNVDQIKRITAMCGARIPDTLAHALEAARSDPAQVHEIAVDHCAEQAEELLRAGVPGIHFYVLNQTTQIAAIMGRIAPTLATAVAPPLAG